MTKRCTDYQPDHNGECLNCDELASDHHVTQLKAEEISIVVRGDRQRVVAWRAHCSCGWVSPRPSQGVQTARWDADAHERGEL